ncbi:MAG TPA: hypothetical protein VKX17_08825 [Planctomycetota bacterium]|nr:hypothetical protein [Planctomycetota bacterium]
MKTIDLAHASNAMEKYIHDSNGETLVFKENGRAVAALSPIDDSDLEDIALSEDPRFLAIMRRADEQIRRGEGIPSEEIMRKYGIAPRTKQKKKKRVRG